MKSVILNHRVLALLTATIIAVVLGWRSFALAQSPGLAVFAFATLVSLTVMAYTVVKQAQLRPSVSGHVVSPDWFARIPARGFDGDPIEPVIRMNTSPRSTRVANEPLETTSLALAKYPQILLATTDTSTKKQYLRAVAGLNYPMPEIAGDGNDVINLISRKHYDFILIDCDLPFPDEQATAQLVRTIEALESGSVVVGMKSESKSGDQPGWCQASATNRWLEKPLDAAAVKNVFLGQPAAEELCLVE